MTTKEVTVMEKKLSPMNEAAEDLIIKDEKTMVKATEMLSQINKIGDAMKAEKDKTMRPALDTVAAIRLQWRTIETRYESAIAIIRQKMTEYQTEKVRIRREEEAKIAARVGEGKGKLKVETAVRQMEEVEKPASTVTTDSGAVKFRAVKKFEVMDMTMLPMQYHLADEVAIRKAMLDGKQLPGVRYYEDQVPNNFR